MCTRRADAAAGFLSTFAHPVPTARPANRSAPSARPPTARRRSCSTQPTRDRSAGNCPAEGTPDSDSFDLPELQGSQFELVGGRVSYLEQSPGAQLLFRVRKHQISVFISRARALPLDFASATR